MKINKKTLIYGMLLAVFILSILPWLKEGTPITDDYRHHASRIWFVKEQIKSVEFSEWVPNMYGGWPFLHFYHPIFYLLSIPFAAIFNPFAALKVMTIVAFAIALFGTFFAAKLLFKDEEIALIAAVAYSLSSHFLFHATVAGALPRVMALAIVPIATAFFIKSLEEDNKKYLVISGILLAILLMTHTSVAVPSLIICGIYVLYNLYLHKDIKKIIKPTIVFLIILGISSAWIIPLVAEKEYGNFPESGEKIGSPLIEQSFRTFGIKHEGSYIRSNYFGYLTLALALISLIFIKGNKTVDFLKVGFISSIFFYFNMFGLLDYIPFMNIAVTGNSAFFISALVFNAVMLAGAGAKSIASKFKKEYIIYALAILIVVDLYPGVNAFTYGWTEKTEDYANPPQLIDAWEFVGRQSGQFNVFSSVGQPAEIYHGKYEFGFDWVGCPQCVQKGVYDLHNGIWKNFTKGIKNDDELGYLGVKYFVVPCQDKLDNKLVYTNQAACVFENEKFRPLIETSAEIKDVKYGLDKLSFRYSAYEATTAIIKMNNFKPHWHAYINSDEVKIMDAPSGFMMIELPNGENDVSIEYKTNTTHIVSWLVTIITITLMIYFVRK